MAPRPVSRLTALFVLLTVLFGAVACDATSVYESVSSPVPVGSTIAYQLSTRCGLGQSLVDMNGTLWKPYNIPAQELNAPPSGMRVPTDSGTLTLVSPTVVRYASSTGRVIDFEPLSGMLTVAGC